MNLLAATYHGRIRPFARLPPMILTGLIRPSDADNYVLFVRHTIPLKNHITIYDNTISYYFYEF